MFPARRGDDLAEVRLLKDHTGKGMPWPSEVGTAGGDGVVDSRHVRPADHVPGRVGVAGTAGRRDAACGNSADVDAFQPCQARLSKDEVDGTDDEALGVELGAWMGKPLLVTDTKGTIN